MKEGLRLFFRRHAAELHPTWAGATFDYYPPAVTYHYSDGVQTGFDTDIEAGGTGSVAVVDGTIPVLRFYETHGAAIGKWCVALAKSDEDGVVDTLTANFDPVP